MSTESRAFNVSLIGFEAYARSVPTALAYLISKSTSSRSRGFFVQEELLLT